MNEKDALGNAQANNARIYSLMFDVYEKVRNAKESIDALIACGADYYKGYKIVGGVSFILWRLNTMAMKTNIFTQQANGK